LLVAVATKITKKIFSSLVFLVAFGF